MMDDIFKKLLEAGILEESAEGIYHFADDPQMASVNHLDLWNIAGALMEKMSSGELSIWQQHYDDDESIWIVETHLQNADGRDESLPCAMIEACMGVLTVEDPGT